MPSPLHPLLALLLLSIFLIFSNPISLFLPFVALLISFSYLSLPISLLPLTPSFPPCPAFTPYLLSFPSSPHLFAYPNSVLPNQKALAALSPPFPQPPHYPTRGDRALPSDYTGGAGLEYSPEGWQLSISDNCREKESPPAPSLIRGASPSNGPEEVFNGNAW